MIFKKTIVSSKFWLNLKVVDDALKSDIYLKNYMRKTYIYGSDYFYTCKIKILHRFCDALHYGLPWSYVVKDRVQAFADA